LRDAPKSVREWEKLGRAVKYKAPRLARHFHVSRKTLERFFKTRFQSTPQRWLGELRLDDVKKELRSGEPPQKLVRKFGFGHLSNLSRDFKKYHGETIKQVKASAR
jgi:AraC-like DNA-binding protein